MLSSPHPPPRPPLRFSRLRSRAGGAFSPLSRCEDRAWWRGARRSWSRCGAVRVSRALSGFPAAAALSLLGNLPPPPGAQGVCGAQTWGRELNRGPSPGLFPLSYLCLLWDQYY